MGTKSSTTYYSHNGLAEMIESPSELSYEFFSQWLKGNNSLGKAMELIRLPYTVIDLPVIEYQDKRFVVNLAHEEATLYARTIFTYKKPHDDWEPQLSISPKKLFNISCLFGTIKLLLVQSQWIAHPHTIIHLLTEKIKNIPEEDTSADIASITHTLGNAVWPVVLAVGMVHEFFSRLLEREAGKNWQDVQKVLSDSLREEDWFFTALTDQGNVKNGTLSFDEYLNRYSLLADNAYELTCPRWREIPELIKERIHAYTNPISLEPKTAFTLPPNLQKRFDEVLALQLLRIEAKKKTLFWIHTLRQAILADKTFSAKMKAVPVKQAVPTVDQNILSHGHGLPISQGVVSGKVAHIQAVQSINDHTIGIFEHAGTTFSHLYPKCAGIIFLSGGQMSHGAIVAREFGIPAIIDPKAQGILNGTKIHVDGTSGSWKIILV